MSGNQYIMLAYHDATNVILVQPFKSQADHHRIPAYNALVARLKARGLTVDLQVLDNQASEAMQQAIREHGWAFQFVPPDMHSRNKAERAIRTFKAHFIAILAGMILPALSKATVAFRFGSAPSMDSTVPRPNRSCATVRPAARGVPEAVGAGRDAAAGPEGMRRRYATAPTSCVAPSQRSASSVVSPLVSALPSGPTV
jgi:hypothetical protein